jgi:S1-C subfamily serine protease
MLACLCGILLSCGQTNRSKALRTPAPPATSKPLPALIDAVRPSVVQIVVRVQGRSPAEYDSCFNGNTSCVAGTGFLVNSGGYAVTAFHVVEGYVGVGRDGKPELHPGTNEVIAAAEKSGTHAELKIGLAIPNIETRQLTVASSTRYFSAKVVATDPAHDLALIQASGNPFTSMPRTFAGPGSEGLPKATAKAVSISTTRPSDGEDIFGCGYPLGSYGLISTPGTIASAWNSQVLLRAAAAGFSHPIEVYEVDLRENPGNSGGPVFRTADQAVIGVDVQSYGNLAMAVPAKFVAAFLDANKISWQSADIIRKPHH